MPETIPPPPPSEHSQPDQQFHMDLEEAQGLGLTNTEAMVHGWTGVMPERVEWHNKGTLWEQTLASRGPFRFSPEERAALAEYWDRQAGRTPATVETPDPEPADVLEPAPPMPDFRTFKPWALAELQVITDEVGQIFAGDPKAAPSTRVLERAQRWDAAYNDARAERQPDPELTAAADATWSLVDDVFKRPDLPADTRADLVDALTHHLRSSYYRPAITQKLAEDILVNGPALAVKLFERQSNIENYGLAAIRQALQTARDPETLREISVHTMLPLARKIGSARKFPDSQFFVMNLVVDSLGESDKSMREAAERGVYFNEVADVLVEGFNAQFQAGANVPHHTDLLKLLGTLNDLYFPQHAAARPVSLDMQAFIERVYQVRIAGRESHPLMKRLAGPFNRLASACGSGLRVRR